MFYDEKPYFDTLKFDDVFPGPQAFQEKLESMMMFDVGKLMPFDELYYLLALKYANASTRYTTEYQFILALIRELNIAYPLYKQQKLLIEEMMTTEIEEVRKGLRVIMNQVNNPNDPTDNPSEIPIPGLSTAQATQTQLLNKIDAIKNKYFAIARDYQKQVYDRLDPLFTVILANDIAWIYPQGGA